MSNDSLIIPKIKRQVSLWVHPEGQVIGSLFLREQSVNHAGTEVPIEVLNKEYGGQVPMTPFGGMLNDEEVAAVLTYVRNSFGNKADPVSPETVARIRSAIKDRTGFYSPEELLQEHPLENNEAL